MIISSVSAPSYFSHVYKVKNIKMTWNQHNSFNISMFMSSIKKINTMISKHIQIAMKFSRAWTMPSRHFEVLGTLGL